MHKHFFCAMDRSRLDTERRLRAMEAAFARERQQRDLLEKKYARLKRRYVRLERSHNRLLMDSNGSDNGGQTSTSQSDTSQSVESTPNSRTSSFSVIDLTSPRPRSSSAMTSNNDPQNSVSRSLRSYALDDICAESPTSSLGSPQLSTRELHNSDDQEEKENTLENWRTNSERTYSTPSSRRRLHLDFTLPSSFTDSNQAISSPSRRMQRHGLHLDQSTTSHSSPQSTHSMTLHSGEPRTRTRPRLGFHHHSPERTAARAYGYELEQELEPRTHHHDRYGWASDPSPAPSPVAAATNLSPVPPTIPSPAPRPRAESDEEASLALARYLQQQENIAAFEEYEARLLRESVQQEYNQQAHLSNNLLLSGLEGQQRNIDPDNMSYEELLRLGEEVGDVKKERWRQMAVRVLSSLPTHKWTHGHGDDTCIICQYNFVPNDRAMTLPCAHVFHEDCVGGWIRENNSCPLCKREITSM
ncbi:hypothetical protein F442_17400 [Phytophthora nicotianae P10297]|uniref:RING-type domain-containing protein n=6 Tax=Phytophthora nicotianae TaxID=4792 RepID=V9ECT4_PHYNI|nr:hypothetical protein F443_17546 [Phytophthora nicotianae P1569]ETK76535.1 hypothetical protein L915_17078 [Phytophthora nicotianae]ETP34249.1 hypothetical protein F442_17400 [Phytophthora nicotianae P10297]